MSSVGRRAFTLVEVTVVLAIVVVLAAMIVPRYAGSLATAELKDSARQLQLSAQHARQYAVTHQRPCRIRLDVAANQYTLECQDPEGQGRFVPVATPSKPVALGKSVKFGRLRIESDQQDEPMVVFSPSGQAQAAVLEVTDGRQTYSVIVVPSTARAKLAQGRVEEPPDDRQDLDL